MRTMEAENIIEMLHITKEFPGIIANDDITLQLRRGEIHALLGENGAGKSTLMSVLFGLYQPEAGEIRKNGQVVKINDPNDATALGIGMVHQHFQLIDVFTVLDNIILGAETTKFGFLQKKEARKKVEELSEKYGLKVDLDAKVEDITVGMQQRVEILKMLYRDNEILIFDEPTAVLTPQEIDELMEIMRGFKAEGKSILFITHKLNEISYVADSITVIRDGHTIETLTKGVDDFSEDRIIKGMVGREMTNRYPVREGVTIGDVIFEVKDWNVYHPEDPNRQVLQNINIKVRAGEVVGLAGLMGAGRTEMVQAAYGVGPLDGGTVTLKGQPLKSHSAKESVSHGLGLVPEDRAYEGATVEMSIRENVVQASLKKLHPAGIINVGREKKATKEFIDKLRIATPTTEKKVRFLSGGTQQKVILAKWLCSECEVLILDEPTRGIDVGAKYEIYELIINMAKQGKTIIVVSSEMPEILGITNRIGVMSNGHLSGIVNTKETDQEELLRLSAKYL